jgi:hypothetical protein
MRRPCPHTTHFYLAFMDSQFIYLVMEYCSGGDLLERLLAEGRAMRERRVALEIAIPLLEALEHMHAHHIIHRCAFRRPTVLRGLEINHMTPLAKEREKERVGEREREREGERGSGRKGTFVCWCSSQITCVIWQSRRCVSRGLYGLAEVCL